MLKFTHDGQTIDVNLEKLPLHEGMALQKTLGKRMPEFVSAVQAGDMEALAALGWVLIKFRMNRDVTFEDVAEGRVVITIADFDDPEAREAASNGEAPPTVAARAAKTRR